MTALFILGFILLTCIVVYFTPRLIVWSISLLIYLILVYKGFSTEINTFAFYLFATIYAVITVVFNLRPLRLQLLSRSIFAIAKRALPKISETEAVALNAGDTWYEKEVFQGNPNFTLLHNSQKFELNDVERSFLNNETEQLCSMLSDWKITNIEKDLPLEVWGFIREKGFLGLVISKEYGGKGFSAAAHSEIVMKIATRCPSAAITVMVPNSLGPGELLHHYGTDQQKNYYLPRLAVGEEIPCFALTGPTAGSDATSIPDLGTVVIEEYEGKETLGIRLTGVDKRYITLAPVATLVGLAFRLKDPNGLLKGLGHEGITCALLPHNHAGLEIGNRLLPLNQVFMNGTVRVKNAFIPIDWIIGGQKMAGEGWRMLVECLSIGRSISLPACGTANALFSCVTTSAYALVREQFNSSIGHFEGVEEGLAKMGGLSYMANATRQFTVAAVDAGIKPSVSSAISKYHLTENGRTVLNWAMDIHAGRAIMNGPNNYLAGGYQSTPIAITVEGANIMTRNLMIFGQGAMRCHPYIRTIYESLMQENGLNRFDTALFSTIGYFAQNKTRAIFNAFTCGHFAAGYPSKFNAYYKKITQLSSAFAYVNDVTLFSLGGELKRKERISARLGDVMSYLYMACASLKYFKDNKELVQDEIFLTWVLEHCLFKAQNALCDALDNFPKKAIGKCVKFLIFPYGKIFKGPSDALEYKISHSLLNNGGTRSAYKAMCYIKDDYADPVGRMEVAYLTAIETLPIRLKISQAVKAKQLKKSPPKVLFKSALDAGIITTDEFSKLELSAKYANEVIQVDEFAPYDLGPKNAHPSWENKSVN